MCLSPVYPEVFARAKAGETVVDIGTFIGHDLRRLVFDGAPSDNLWGIDIVNHFDVGFDFFQDREHWKGRFIEADFLTVETSNILQPLRGKVDIIFLASVLHQWDWKGQLNAAAMLAYFTKPGSLIVGLQMGKPVAGEVTTGELKVPLFLHTPESFANLWNEAGESTSTKWETEAWPRSWEHIGVDPADMAWMGADVRPFEFAVRRVRRIVCGVSHCIGGQSASRDTKLLWLISSAPDDRSHSGCDSSIDISMMPR